MASHDSYGKDIIRKVAGGAFKTQGRSVEVDYRAGKPARIDGTIGSIAIEIESRTAKQVRGAVMDLICHLNDKKLLVLIPMHMSDPEVCADQCRYMLGKCVNPANFEVVVLKGTGASFRSAEDTKLITQALEKLGYNPPRAGAL